MYVCICKAVTDRQIRSAVQDGVTSMSGLRKTLGCAGQCGKCGRHVKEIRDEVVGASCSDANLMSIPAFSAA